MAVGRWLRITHGTKCAEKYFACPSGEAAFQYFDEEFAKHVATETRTDDGPFFLVMQVMCACAWYLRRYPSDCKYTFAAVWEPPVCWTWEGRYVVPRCPFAAGEGLSEAGFVSKLRHSLERGSGQSEQSVCEGYSSLRVNNGLITGQHRTDSLLSRHFLDI